MIMQKLQKRIVLLCCFSLASFLLLAQHTQKGNNYSETDANLQVKFAKLLQVPRDSFRLLPMYETIDRWPEYVTRNPQKIQTSAESVFVQFVYYLAFNAKIASSIQGIFNSSNVYVFKNTHYLSAGDIVFWGIKETTPLYIGIFTQNGKVLRVNDKGEFVVENLPDLKDSFAVVAAKVVDQQ